jgi:hypothetical protein
LVPTGRVADRIAHIVSLTIVVADVAIDNYALAVTLFVEVDRDTVFG